MSNYKRRILILITIATTGMMGACSADEPEPESTTASDILTAPWANATQDQRDAVCENYAIMPEHSAESMANTTGVTLVEASDFLYNVC